MKLPVASFGKSFLPDFGEAVTKEWVLANGLGGYASSTLFGLNTRKYHGLLVAAFDPPEDRRVCLEKLDEEVRVGKDVFGLGCNEFQNVVCPEGHEFLQEFSMGIFPRFVYRAGAVDLIKTVFLPREENAVVSLYSVSNGSDDEAAVKVFPLVNSRGFHSVTNRHDGRIGFSQDFSDGETTVSSAVPRSVLKLKTIGGRYVSDEKWIDRVFYRVESQRGESCFDDCFQPGYCEFSVGAGETEEFAVVGAADDREESARAILGRLPATIESVRSSLANESQRCLDYLGRFYADHVGVGANAFDWLDWLVLAADSFVVRTVEQQRSVIAGYHWFDSWGRDTFISLPGLLLVNGRFGDARQIFLEFRDHCQNGLIPNVFGDESREPIFNSVDASLWFVNAALQYVKYTGDFAFVKDDLWDTLKVIVDGYSKGTLFGIHVDGDCLVAHGGGLTWMDARIDGVPVTPRAGKAVEIQALLFNALKVMELFAARFGEGDAAKTYSVTAERAKSSFNGSFWNADKSCLCDVLLDGSADKSLRPNQIFAVSLDFPVLDQNRMENVVDFVQGEFLTPVGLRTLSRSDSRYASVYAGDRRTRDRAYHNGAVWPFLLGPFVRAYLRVKGYSDADRKRVLDEFLSPLLRDRLHDLGVGTISEVFDGDPPYRAGGCVAQAWSVAEVLRVYVEDVLSVRPKFEKEILK